MWQNKIKICENAKTKNVGKLFRNPENPSCIAIKGCDCLTNVAVPLYPGLTRHIEKNEKYPSTMHVFVDNLSRLIFVSCKQIISDSK